MDEGHENHMLVTNTVKQDQVSVAGDMVIESLGFINHPSNIVISYFYCYYYIFLTHHKSLHLQSYNINLMVTFLIQIN